MDRRASIPRCVTVWLVVTSAVTGLLSWLAGDLVRSRDLVASGQLAAASFDQLLALLAALALATCALWFWLVTSVVTLEAARGPTAGDMQRLPTIGCPQGTRRLLFAACGLALASGLVTPATAVEGQQHRAATGPAMLAGLPLPERASTHPAAAVESHAPGSRPAPTRPRAVQVRAGDTLWSLAAATLAPQADDAEITATWRAIYEHNRGVIGDDPDLIKPGTTLTIPDSQQESR